MSRWGAASKATKSMGGGGKYIKLKDGDSVKFAVTDSAIGKEITYWKDGEKVSEHTPGGEMNTKIVLGVWDLEAQCMRVMRVTPNTFRTIAEKIEEFGEGRIYRIKRYRDAKDFVSYAIDQIDRLEAEVVERIARETPIDILAENDVWPLETAAEPAPAATKQPPARAPEKPRTSNTMSGGRQPLPAMPPGQQPGPDDDVPF